MRSAVELPHPQRIAPAQEKDRSARGHEEDARERRKRRIGPAEKKAAGGHVNAAAEGRIERQELRPDPERAVDQQLRQIEDFDMRSAAQLRKKNRRLEPL